MAASPNAKLTAARLRIQPTSSNQPAAVDDAPAFYTANGGGRGRHHHHTAAPRKTLLWAADAVLSLLDLRAAKSLSSRHPRTALFFLSVCFFAGVEYTLTMVPPHGPPYDLGFVLTAPLHRGLAVRPRLNSVLAALNTVFVAMQALYIFWALLVRGRSRPTVAALFMFTCRGILGYSTQLPLPHEFLPSAMDFPVANVSFFLFFSGHVAGALIASLDMRRQRNAALANAFDALNVMQALRLLATRGHYTIDLAVGVGAGVLFDYLAANYEIAAAKMPHQHCSNGHSISH